MQKEPNHFLPDMVIEQVPKIIIQLALTCGFSSKEFPTTTAEGLKSYVDMIAMPSEEILCITKLPHIHR